LGASSVPLFLVLCPVAGSGWDFGTLNLKEWQKRRACYPRRPRADHRRSLIRDQRRGPLRSPFKSHPQLAKMATQEPTAASGRPSVSSASRDGGSASECCDGIACHCCDASHNDRRRPGRPENADSPSLLALPARPRAPLANQGALSCEPGKRACASVTALCAHSSSPHKNRSAPLPIGTSLGSES
jgi:hypothetical protein